MGATQKQKRDGSTKPCRRGATVSQGWRVLNWPGPVRVMKVARIGMDELIDAEGESVHVKQLVGLKHWARPLTQQSEGLALDDGRLTFHVLEAPDPAAAIVDFAERNHVDHIVMGARGASTLRRYLGSVSSEVVAKSDCTVTVVRE